MDTCLPKSIPGLSDLLSIPNFIMSKAYPSIKNITRIKTIIPTILNPLNANPAIPFDENEAAIEIRDAPPIIPAIMPKIAYNTNALILLNGYAIASPIISPIPFIFIC